MEYEKTADKQSYDYAVRAMTMHAQVYHTTQTAAMAKRILELDPTNAQGDGAQASWTLLQQVPRDRWEADGSVYRDNLKRFDAANARGLLEKANWAYAYGFYQQKKFAKCIEVLTELSKVGALRNPQDTFGLLGYAQAEGGQKEQAMATLQKAIALDPGSRIGKMLQSKLDALQQGK